jgi:WD40 repeat protein
VKPKDPGFAPQQPKQTFFKSVFFSNAGEMSMFEFSTESNKLRKKLAIHKGAVRSVEFDGSGKFLVSGSKDKSFKVTDVVSI